MARNKQDEGMDVRFYHYPVDDRIHISLQQSGDKTTIIDEYVSESEYDHWKRRFPDEWAAFQKGMSQVPAEMSLEFCAWIDFGMRREMNGAGIHTVPQLARLTDTSMDQIGLPAIRPLVRRAQEEVERWEKEKAAQERESAAKSRQSVLESEVEKLRKELAEVKAGKVQPPPDALAKAKAGLKPPLKRASR